MHADSTKVTESDAVKQLSNLSVSSSSGLQATKKSTSSALDVSAGQPSDTSSPSTSTAFGSRFLTDPSKIFTQNAWDHVEFTPSEEAAALSVVETHKSKTAEKEKIEDYHENAATYWNMFYERNEERFFKDRHWLGIEFPELFPPSIAESDRTATDGPGDLNETFNVLEVGCGAGNTVYPLISDDAKNRENDKELEQEDGIKRQRRRLFVYACDFSQTAVNLVKSNPAYDPDKVHAFTYDLTSPTLPSCLKPASIDVLVLVFVLSAIHPTQFQHVIGNIYNLLKPGGLLLFRDYGRYDLAQLRMKPGRLLDMDNFYVRGDGTRVYFFETTEIRQLVENAGLKVEQLAVDRRLIVNRGKKLQMHRVWLQGKFRKPADVKT
ncbi:S-adenosyl-L-methionine-dependent methyltransferase [Paraphysoderma sedebokerense]|nr:S-adenosyl-L-methionine-dependent methyltransferase [Paraphysoderma sedebokerense]